MTGYLPTRGRGNNCKSRGRSSCSARDEGTNGDKTSSEDHVNIGDDVVGLSDSLNVNEEDETSIEEDGRRKKKRGRNHGTRLPKSPEERPTITVKTPQGFNIPDTRREITQILQGFTQGRYMRYCKVPKKLHDNMFKVFKEKFQWPNHTDDEVEKVFRTIDARRLRDNLCGLREKAKDETNSNNPQDWKQLKPDWIDEGDWIKLLEQWGSFEWQHISHINSKNRASTVNGPHPKHTCGSVSSAVHEDRLLKN